VTRVVCIGECMVELRAAGDDSFKRTFAGDAFNTAVYLKRSLPTAQVQFLTATGDDAMSTSMRRSWRAHEIDDALAFAAPDSAPGLYLIETDAQGERRFHYWRKDSAARRWLSLLLEVGEKTLWGADLVYVSGIALAILPAPDRTLAIALLRRLHGRVGCLAFDPNVRLNLWESPLTATTLLEEAIAAADIVLPSGEDLNALFGIEDPEGQMQQLLNIGVPEAALTLGAEGCIVFSDRQQQRLPALRTAMVIDTSGAGDAFNGAYLAARLRNLSPRQAAEQGLAVATRVVTQSGAIVDVSVSHPLNQQRGVQT
jgi:2-dehydro-3-deoxygluconokinase